MATERGRNGRRVGTRTSSSSPAPVVQEIVPNSGWTEDPSCHFLLVDLPEFRKEEVNLQVDGSSGRIIVKGERRTNEQKRVHFELTFPVPADSDVNNITGNFDSEILCVSVPKRPSQERRSENEIEKASNGNVERPQEIESEEQNVEERDHAPHDVDGEKEERRNENGQRMEGFCEELTKNWTRKHDMSRAIVEVLMRNKGVVITAVVAFSFGLYVSHKFHSWNAP